MSATSNNIGQLATTINYPFKMTRFAQVSPKNGRAKTLRTLLLCESSVSSFRPRRWAICNMYSEDGFSKTNASRAQTFVSTVSPSIAYHLGRLEK
jgi:hypothetical protein